jgi:hypothetical protein
VKDNGPTPTPLFCDFHFPFSNHYYRFTVQYSRHHEPYLCTAITLVLLCGMPSALTRAHNPFGGRRSKICLEVVDKIIATAPQEDKDRNLQDNGTTIEQVS